MFTALVAEDDANIRKLIEIKLKNAGYNVVPAFDGVDALNKFYENHIDIMLVDVMMPNMDGYEFLQKVRKENSQIPAIICTAKGDISDKAIGYDSGADDYIVKPYDMEELLMRMKALLKRFQIASDRRIVIGDVTLEYDTLEVKDDVNTVSLTKKEFSILFKLLSSTERTFSKDQLYEEFWDYDSLTDEDVVKVFINKIRNKIACFENIGIDTIRGVGYRGIKK